MLDLTFLTDKGYECSTTDDKDFSIYKDGRKHPIIFRIKHPSELNDEMKDLILCALIEYKITGSYSPKSQF
jgi:hypothetical protein